jgi:hypothetical protein
MMIDEMVYMNELAKITNTKVILKDSGIDIEELRKTMDQPGKVIGIKSFSDVHFLNEELEAASHYIEENEVIHVKTKRDIPTVIEYQGRRYILDHSDTMKGGAKR